MADTKFPRLRGGAIGATAVVAPLVAGIAYSALAIDYAVPLAPAIEAERRTLRAPVVVSSSR